MESFRSIALPDNMIKDLIDVLEEIASPYAVTFEDERVDYLEIQVYKGTLKLANRLLHDLKGFYDGTATK